MLAVRKITTLLPGSTAIYENLVSFCESVFGPHWRVFSPCSYVHVLKFLLHLFSKKTHSHWISLISESRLKLKLSKSCVKCKLLISAVKMELQEKLWRIHKSFQPAHKCSRNINLFVNLKCYTSYNKWIRDWTKKLNAQVWSHSFSAGAYLLKIP